MQNDPNLLIDASAVRLNRGSAINTWDQGGHPRSYILLQLTGNRGHRWSVYVINPERIS